MINKVIQMGRITHTPELKQTTTGIPVLRFSLAVDRSVADSNGERQTDFFDCVAWRKTAEFISRYFGKGDMIAIVGELQSRKYTARDNTQRIAIEIIVGEASFCGSKREKAFDSTESTAATQKPQEEPQNAPQYVQGADGDFETISDDDELPF